MSLDLLGNNIIIVFSMAFAVLTFYSLFNLYKHQKPLPRTIKRLSKQQKIYFRKVNRVQFAMCILLGLILAILLTGLVSRETDSPLPTDFFLMCVPFTLSLSIAIWALFFKKKFRILTGCSILVGFVFSLIIINGYYRYYPTLGQVFGKTNAKELNNVNAITVNYTVQTNQTQFNKESVQGSIENISDSATASATAGKVYQINVPGTVSKFKARPGYVYVPAVYNSPAEVNLPVVILLAGVPGMPLNWLGLGLQNIMDDFAKTHDGITPLVFVVDDTGTINNDTECVNSPRGNVETYLTVDVTNYIKKNFRVDDQPNHWAIGGLSLGGMCGLMLTLTHPNIYNYFIDLGGEIGPEIGSKDQTIDTLFGGSEASWAAHQPDLLLANHTYKNIGGFFGDGQDDYLSVTEAIAQLSAESKKAGVDSVTEIIDGSHTFNVWAQTYKEALPWISNRVGATECNSACL